MIRFLLILSSCSLLPSTNADVFNAFLTIELNSDNVTDQVGAIEEDLVRANASFAGYLSHLCALNGAFTKYIVTDYQMEDAQRAMAMLRAAYCEKATAGEAISVQFDGAQVEDDEKLGTVTADFTKATQNRLKYWQDLADEFFRINGIQVNKMGNWPQLVIAKVPKKSDEDLYKQLVGMIPKTWKLDAEQEVKSLSFCVKLDDDEGCTERDRIDVNKCKKEGDLQYTIA